MAVVDLERQGQGQVTILTSCGILRAAVENSALKSRFIKT
jgi:hypothetical protein